MCCGVSAPGPLRAGNKCFSAVCNVVVDVGVDVGVDDVMVVVDGDDDVVVVDADVCVVVARETDVGDVVVRAVHVVLALGDVNVADVVDGVQDGPLSLHKLRKQQRLMLVRGDALCFDT